MLKLGQNNFKVVLFQESWEDRKINAPMEFVKMASFLMIYTLSNAFFSIAAALELACKMELRTLDYF